MSEEIGPPAVEIARAPRSGRRYSLPVVGVATILVAIAGYLIIFIAFRVLGPAGYAHFAIFWSALYIVAGSIFGVQQETTRSVRMAAGLLDGSKGARALWPGMLIGAVIALGILATASLWAPALFGENATLFSWMLATGAVLYSGHSVTAGSLAGRGLWGGYSVLLVTESFVRVGAVLLVVALGLGLPAIGVVATLAMGSWLVFLAVPAFRGASLGRIDAPMRRATVRSAQSLLAAAASALLVTGFPVILGAASPNEDPALLGVVILVVTLTRAPIMLPLNAFLGMIVAAFVDRRDARLNTVLRPMLLVAGGGVVLAGLATLLGAPILTWLFGAKASTSPFFIGGATLAAAFIGVLSISGAATLARGHHLGYSLGWLAAAGIACATLILPISLEARVILALVVGPLIGVLIHLGVLVAKTRSTREESRRSM
ncbi:MAG TPA: hypothetical protein VGO31_16535 [Microbacteriaceae bacterium]|nr:hypothetical protein [Microbacteriaceae bacterium]